MYRTYSLFGKKMSSHKSFVLDQSSLQAIKNAVEYGHLFLYTWLPNFGVTSAIFFRAGNAMGQISLHCWRER